jgi:hypothetical protein
MQVSESWHSTMQSAISVLKQKWDAHLKNSDWQWTKFYNTELSAEDWEHVRLIPIPVFTLDSIYFANLNKTSIMEPLLILDETVADILFYNHRIDKCVAFGGGKYRNNEWKSTGYGGIGYSCIEIINNIIHKSEFIATVEIILLPQTNPKSRFGFTIFYDNGKLMSIREGSSVKPLNEALIEYREYLEAQQKH